MVKYSRGNKSTWERNSKEKNARIKDWETTSSSARRVLLAW